MDTLALLINRIEAARRWTKSLLWDVRDEEYFFQPSPGLHTPAWIVGHLTWAQWGLVAVRCFGRPPLAEPYPGLFGRGTTPSGDASKHPKPAALRAELDRVHGEAIGLIRTMSEAQLGGPPGGDPHPMFTTQAELVGMVAMHESFHAGQLALLRRLMGHAPQR
jgi:hypothetical protein